MNKNQSTFISQSNQDKINNFIKAMNDLTIDDSSDLSSFKGKLTILKKQFESRKLDIETLMKINMINGILKAMAKETYWYYNMNIKRKIEEEPSSSKKSKNG